jgi:hypothetical protein
MRETNVPDCGKISTSPSAASRNMASRTGVQSKRNLAFREWLTGQAP